MISIALAPILITLGETIQHHRLPTMIATATVTAATFGLVLVTLGGLRSNTTSPHPFIGVACAFGSGVGYAATIVLTRRAAATVTPLALTTVTTTLGAIVLAPRYRGQGARFIVAGSPVLELAYLGPMTTAVAFALFYLGLRTTATSTAAVLTLLEPLAAAGLATACERTLRR